MDPVFVDDEDEAREKTERVARFLEKLSRYEVKNLMEDREYEDTVHYCTYGESLTIVVR